MSATAPPPTLTSTAPPTRSLAPDLARGFMLLLIAVANSSWYLWGHPGSTTSAHPTDGTRLDQIIRAVLAITVDGRILPLFAFLFGYGMVQFARARSARGIQRVDIRRMLRRRHWAMVLLGFLHALLLFGGDIVGAYGVLGLILVVALFEASNRALKIAFWLLVAYALVSGITAMVSMGQLQAMGFDPAGEEFAMPFSLADLMSGLPNYLIAMAVRVGMWLAVGPALLFTGIIPAAVILGWLFARHEVLDHPDRYRPQLIKLAVGGIALGWLTGVPVALEHLGRPILSEAMGWGYVTLNFVGGTAAGVGYAAAIALIAGAVRARPNAVVRSFAAVGKRSLTFYLFQSVIFAPLLSAWGLGLGERINTTAAVAIAFGIWVVSIVLAGILEATGRPGPGELLLRRLTYLPPEKLTAPAPAPPLPPGLDRHPPSPQRPADSTS